MDVLGLTTGVPVLPASAHANEAGIFKDAVIIHGAVNDVADEVVRRNPADEGKGFVPQPKRWVVEQVNGTLMLHRRLVRDYDHGPHNADPSPVWRDDMELAA